MNDLHTWCYVMAYGSIAIALLGLLYEGFIPMVHRTALIMSSIAMRLDWRWLWEQGGALELWCDEHS